MIGIKSMLKIIATEAVEEFPEENENENPSIPFKLKVIKKEDNTLDWIDD